MKDSRLKKETYLPYPICFKKFRIGIETVFTHCIYHNNDYYNERRFVPQKFYKAIIKL